MCSRLFLWFCFVLPFTAAAQTVVGGIINTYHRVTQTNAVGWVRVNTTVGLAAGDLVLIIQMKGASINTSPNSSFGQVINLNEAGNYELNSICAVRSDTVYLFRQLAQTYNTAQKVQLVKVPQYASAVVATPLQATPWDSTAGIGGVVAIRTGGSLILNAPVSASGAGYRGGASVTSSGICNNFFSPAIDFHYDASATNPQDGAYKGEGVTSLNPEFTGGKGAAANGGGGGNNHNNGGGGGAHMTTGGIGGGNSSTGGCRVSNPGQGGYALNNGGGTKLFLGGGGGAGHMNSGAATTGGGRGGGIVFIIADELLTNGYSIEANGATGGAATGDGASGGGAGGTVVLSVNQYLDAVQVAAAGGNGGTEDDVFTSGRCFGEGGGGSGGVVYFKNAVPAGTVTVAGGRKGDRLNSLDCGPIISGADGLAGTVISNYSFIESPTLATPCGALLDVQLIYFRAQPHKNDVLLQWKASGTNSVAAIILERKNALGIWTQLAKASPTIWASNQYIDRQLSTGNYSYRLRLMLHNGREIISGVQTVSIGLLQLLLVPNPAKDLVTINYPFTPNTIVWLTDVSGRVVLKQNISTATNLLRLPISHLGRGIYLLRVGNSTARLMIQ